MKDNNCRHIPVIDVPEDEGEKPYFVGVVSQRDLFRQVSPFWGTLSEVDEDTKALQKCLSELVTRKPKYVSPATPMPDVIQTMVDNRVDIIPVLVDKDLVGIITATDILKVFVMLAKISKACKAQEKKTRLVDLLSDSANLGGPSFSHIVQTVQDFMTEEVVCLGPTDTLPKAIDAMQRGRFRHVPVVDAQGQLVGITSDRDVLLNLWGNVPLPGQKLQNGSDGFRQSLFTVDPKHPSLRRRLEEIMKRKVVHISLGCSVYEAANKLYDERVSCLPVIDEKRNIRGIVTVTDLMRSLLATYKLLDKLGGCPAAVSEVVS